MRRDYEVPGNAGDLVAGTDGTLDAAGIDEVCACWAAPEGLAEGEGSWWTWEGQVRSGWERPDLTRVRCLLESQDQVT